MNRQQELLNHPQLAQAALDAHSDHIAVVDSEGVIIAVNNAWREYATANSSHIDALIEGASYFQICERATSDGVVDGREFLANLRLILDGRRSEFSLEYPCHSPFEQRWYRAGVRRFDVGGEVHALITHTNISARRLAEQALEFRSDLLNTVEQAVIAIDLAGVIIYGNRFVEQLYGWQLSDLLGKNISELIPTQGMEARSTEIMARLVSGKSWSGEFTVRRRDGKTFPAYIVDTPIFDEGGKVVGIVGISTDMTDRKTAEEKLRESEGRYRAMISQAMIGVAHCDLNGRLTLVNQRYCEITGYSESELIGMQVQSFTFPDDLPRTNELFKRVVSDGVPIEIEKRYQRKDGSIIWVHIGASAILDREGKPASAVAAILDITDRKRSENLLDAQKESLEMVVTGVPLNNVLTYLTRVVEQQSDGHAVASVLLLDEQGRLRNGASPSLPEHYINAIDGLSPDPDVGTCAAAAALGTVVITPNIATDPAWHTLKHLPLELGFKAAWSMPILARDGAVLGTFGTYFRECRTPLTLEQQAVGILARTASLAIERHQAEQRLLQSEKQLRAIFEASRDGILVEQDEQIVYVNNSYAELLGYQKPEDLIGTHVSVVMSVEDRERMTAFGRRRVIGQEAPVRYEFKGLRRDGVLLDLEASVSTHKVGGKMRITTTIRDIAERKRAQEALKRSERKYRMLMEQASDGIHTYDSNGNFIEANSKLCEMLGYSREEILRLNVKDLVPPEELSESPILFDQLQAGRTLLTERQLRRKDGTLLPVEISGKMVQEGIFQAIIRDITMRKRAEDELRRAHDDLEKRVEERTAEIAGANELLKKEMAERVNAELARQEMLRRLVYTQEEERRRISRELHDQMGQQLIALMMGLKTLRAASYGRKSAYATLKLQEITDQLTQLMHSLAWELRPPPLDDLGLDKALLNYLEAWAQRSQVRVDFHSSGFESGRLPLVLETTIYRIAQEALTNVVKHSGADQVSLIVERRADEIVTVIEDNGTGFDVDTLTLEAVKEGKLGLLGMRERAQLLGGKIAVESTPAGTSVFVRIPVMEEHGGNRASH